MSSDGKETTLLKNDNPSTTERCISCGESYNTTTRSWVPLSCGHAYCSKCLASKKKKTVFRCAECQQPTMVRYNKPRKGQFLPVEKITFNKGSDDGSSVEASSSDDHPTGSRSTLPSIPCSEGDNRPFSGNDKAETSSEQFGNDCLKHVDMIQNLMKENHEYRRQIGSFKKVSRDMNDFLRQLADPSDPWARCHGLTQRLHQWQQHQDRGIETPDTVPNPPPFQPFHASQNAPPSFTSPPPVPQYVPTASAPPPNWFNRSLPAFHPAHMAPVPVAVQVNPFQSSWICSSYAVPQPEMMPPMYSAVPFQPHATHYQEQQVYYAESYEQCDNPSCDANGDKNSEKQGQQGH